MKNKVSIREVVATKIIIAILIAGYYWMWSRSDWQPEYRQFSSYWGFLLFLILIVHYFRVKKYKKEYFDEFAEKNLLRCDAICLKVFLSFDGHYSIFRRNFRSCKCNFNRSYGMANYWNHNCNYNTSYDYIFNYGF